MALRIGTRAKVTKAGTASFGKLGEVAYLTAERAFLVLDDGSTTAPLLTSIAEITPVQPEPRPEPFSFELGVKVPGDWPGAPQKAVKAISARVARLSTERGTATQQKAAAVEAAAAGARPQVLVEDWRTRTPAQLVDLAKVYVPLDLTHMEIGNEDSYGYQGKTPTAQIPAVSAQYARQVKAYAEALRAAGLTVGLLAQADDALRGPGWVNGMYAAVPNLHDYVAGWTVHPYTAGREVERLKLATSQTVARGAPADMPIYVTEWGLACTATGATLTPDNYGHPLTLTHQQAAALAPRVIAAMRADCPQLRQIVLYDSHDGATASSDREKNFGVLLYPNLAEKPHYAAALRTIA